MGLSGEGEGEMKDNDASVNDAMFNQHKDWEAEQEREGQRSPMTKEQELIITPEDTIRMLEAFLTAFGRSERKGVATQIYNAMFTVGYRLIPKEEDLPTKSGLVPPKPTGAQLISIERERQMSEEGWDAQHDAKQLKAELAQAAICYAADTAAQYETPNWRDELRSLAIHFWPWDKQWWKPTPNNPIRQLTKAGALIAAEIDRLQRASSHH